MKSELVDVDGKLRWATEKAFLVDTGADEPVWLPKQFVEDNQDGTFTMPRWFAEKKGLV